MSKTDMTDRTDKTDMADRTGKTDRIDRTDRTDKTGGTGRADKSVKFLQSGNRDVSLSRTDNILENIFVVVLALYPLRHIGWGLDLWDTGYNYANFQYMGTEHMDPMWLFSTYLSNVVGNLIMRLPNAGSLWGMNFFTGLFVSLLALMGFFFCYRVLKMPGWIAFVGELLAVSLCWCPTALLYNYLTYVLFLVCVILLYRGLIRDKKWCLFAAGVCLGANVLVRFSNLPEAAMILAVWAYDFILWLESKRKDTEEKETEKKDTKKKDIKGKDAEEKDIKEKETGEKNTKEQETRRFWSRISRHTLWCLLGYLAALAVLYVYIQIRYGMGQYIAGVMRLFAMTENATDYKATSMLMGMVNAYVENLYWVVRIGMIVFGGMILIVLSGLLKGMLDRYSARFDEAKIKAVDLSVRIFMGLFGLVIAGLLYYQGFLVQLLSGSVSVRQFGKLSLTLIMFTALAYFTGERAFSTLLGLGLLGWLYFRGFCSLAFYSYDSILRPGILFLMLTMLIALIRIFHPKCPKEEKLISGLVLLVVLITPIGSNNGVYPSLNNLFIAAPYTLWLSFRFLRNISEKRFKLSGLSELSAKGVLAVPPFKGFQGGRVVLPAKGALAAFLLMCCFQFGLFGFNFVFAEATGVQNALSFVENNKVLKNIRMSADKALWMSELSAYVDENDLQGQEVILYGKIPSLSYYLQMPSAFNPWSDLDSYSVEQMSLDLTETAHGMEPEDSRPVIIVEREYIAWMTGGASALKELGAGEWRINEIARDQKWVLLLEFMEEHGYEQDFSNGKFTVYR